MHEQRLPLSQFVPLEQNESWEGYLQLSWKVLQHLLCHVLLTAITVGFEELEVLHLLAQAAHVLHHPKNGNPHLHGHRTQQAKTQTSATETQRCCREFTTS